MAHTKEEQLEMGAKPVYIVEVWDNVEANGDG